MATKETSAEALLWASSSPPNYSFLFFHLSPPPFISPPRLPRREIQTGKKTRKRRRKRGKGGRKQERKGHFFFSSKNDSHWCQVFFLHQLLRILFQKLLWGVPIRGQVGGGSFPRHQLCNHHPHSILDPPPYSNKVSTNGLHSPIPKKKITLKTSLFFTKDHSFALYKIQKEIFSSNWKTPTPPPLPPRPMCAPSPWGKRTQVKGSIYVFPWERRGTQPTHTTVSRIWKEKWGEGRGEKKLHWRKKCHYMVDVRMMLLNCAWYSNNPTSDF